MNFEHKDIPEQTPSISPKALQNYLNALLYQIETMMDHQREAIINPVTQQTLLANEIIKFGQFDQITIDVPLEPSDNFNPDLDPMKISIDFSQKQVQPAIPMLSKLIHSAHPKLAPYRNYGLLVDLHEEFKKMGRLFDHLKLRVQSK